MEQRLRALLKHGDPLEKLAATVDFEMFRAARDCQELYQRHEVLTREGFSFSAWRDSYVDAPSDKGLCLLR